MDDLYQWQQAHNESLRREREARELAQSLAREERAIAEQHAKEEARRRALWEQMFS